MNIQFCIALILFLTVPYVVNKIFKIEKIFPMAFLQLLLGWLFHVSGADEWARLHHIDFLNGPLANSISGLGLLGISLLIALTATEVAPKSRHKKNWLFIPVSITGFFTTLLLGSIVGYVVSQLAPGLIGHSATAPLFAVAIGLCLSVTALPVLIGILNDTRMANTHVGRLAINCAVLDDLWMWIGLALILSVSEAKAEPGLTLVLVVTYLAVMVAVIRPVLRWWFERHVHMKPADKTLFVVCFIFISALFTGLAGIHTIFGAFVAGAIMPRQATEECRAMLLHLADTILLPFFFVLTGMRLSVQTGDATFWMLAAVFTLCAITGKISSVAVAGRYCAGLSWPQAFTLGNLMQCKGLMELIAITILLEANIITPVVFSALAMMALTCTFITAPVLRFTCRPSKTEADPILPVV